MSSHSAWPPIRPPDRPGPTNSPRRPHSVFDKPLALADIAGTTACPKCGGAVPYRLSQVGSDLVCPACGEKSVRVGENLKDEWSAARRAFLDKPYQVLVTKRPNFVRHQLAALLMFVFVVLSVMAGWMFTASGTSPPFSGWLTWKAEAGQRGKAPDGTALADVNLPLLEPAVALEAIEQLLQQSDAHAALVQAQLWRQMLRDYGVSDSDPRLLQLTAIIADLREKLKPPPKVPPAFLAEFRTALDDLRRAVADGNIPDSRAILARVEALFDLHSHDLAPYSRSFLALKHRYRQLVLAQEGRARIAQSLAAAEALIQKAQPLEATQELARTRFLALHTPLENAEWEESDKAVRRLDSELRLARGKRAVENAEQCHQQRDLQARNLQLKVAFAILPDLPGNQVADLLVRAKKISSDEITGPVATALGRELAFYASLEEALKSYGRREMIVQLAESCTETERLLRAAQLPDERSEQVADLILETLECEVADLLSLPSKSPEVAAGLALSREALGKAITWKKSSRWVSVDQTLRSKEDEVALIAITAATAKAAGGDLTAAVALVGPARSLGGPDSRSKADGLYKQWDAELTSRARLAAQEEAWNELIALYRQGKVIETWILLEEFALQFPDSSRAGQLADVQRKLRPTVEAAVDNQFKEVSRLYISQQWTTFREAAERLGQTLLTPEQQSRYESIKESFVKLDEQSQEFFLKASAEKSMGNDKVVISVLESLAQCLQLNPHHEGAQKLQKSALERAAQIGNALLLGARSAGPKSLTYADNLKRVVRLDPEGKLGLEAKELLAKAE